MSEEDSTPRCFPGKAFGKWTIIERDTVNRKKYICKCECGTIRPVSQSNLGRASFSCGCTPRPPYVYRKPRKHTKHPLHGTWRQMIYRCERPKNCRFHVYGGRGIKVCQRWRNSFMDFVTDMGPKPTPKHTLDRKDNKGDYCPENCQWATSKQQANNKSTSRLITYGGRTQSLAEWAAEIGVDWSTLKWRLKRWPFEKAMTAPADETNAHRMARMRQKAVAA